MSINKILVQLLAAKQAYAKDESGATAIEYSLIAAGISLAIVAAVFAFGDQLQVLFNGLKNNLTGAH